MTQLIDYEGKVYIKRRKLLSIFRNQKVSPGTDHKPNYFDLPEDCLFQVLNFLNGCPRDVFPLFATNKYFHESIATLPEVDTVTLDQTTLACLKHVLSGPNPFDSCGKPKDENDDTKLEIFFGGEFDNVEENKELVLECLSTIRKVTGLRIKTQSMRVNFRYHDLTLVGSPNPLKMGGHGSLLVDGPNPYFDLDCTDTKLYQVENILYYVIRRILVPRGYLGVGQVTFIGEYGGCGLFTFDGEGIHVESYGKDRGEYHGHSLAMLNYASEKGLLPCYSISRMGGCGDMYIPGFTEEEEHEICRAYANYVESDQYHIDFVEKYADGPFFKVIDGRVIAKQSNGSWMGSSAKVTKTNAGYVVDRNFFNNE